MTSILYPDFLENYDRYQEVERFWQELFDKITTAHDWTWEPWMNPFFSDGTPFFDGNPIFNAYVPQVDRGIRILQIEPEDSDEFYFYEDSVERTDGSTFPEMVISLILTNETKELVEEVIPKWLLGEPVNLNRNQIET